MPLSRDEKLRCLEERRRDDLLVHPTLNGIDFVEFREDSVALDVTFLRDAPAALVGALDAFRVAGGERIVGIRVLDVQATANPLTLRVFLDQSGDFSTYELRITHASIDRRLSIEPFGFKAGCPSDFDCRVQPECPPDVLPEPPLDYLAKDYASFRRLLLDLATQRNPDWLARNPADLGVALIELLAYAGDHLSYLQDAVATEAYLDTCRRRESAKRHTRLIDYRMHDGRNAWSYVQFEVSSAGVVPQGTQLLTRVARPLRGKSAPPGTVISNSVALDYDDPALRGVTVFETTARIRVSPDHNELFIHSWGDRECCLGRGTREAWLYRLGPDAGSEHKILRPSLEAGDYVLLEEFRSPRTGAQADADPARRQVVRLCAVADGEDTVYRDQFIGGALVAAGPGDAPLPLQRVVWRAEDGLRFPLCLSSEQPETGPILDVARVRGNVAPCDHGRTIVESLAPPTPEPSRQGILRVGLSGGPLTFQRTPDDATYDLLGRAREGRHELGGDARTASPAVVLLLGFAPAETEIWTPVPQLLDSDAFDQHCVADVDVDGRASLRFGDDAYGRRPLGAIGVTSRYRVGNGRAGNLGAGALIHVVQPSAADMVDPADPTAPLPVFPDDVSLYQPLPATGGADPESVEQARQRAPSAFHAEQFRAVTEADYEAAAMKLPALAAAKASFRWTGSWHTVLLAVHPRDPDRLVPLSGGISELDDGLGVKLTAQLTRYKLAGYDLVIRAAQYVPLEIDIRICVAPGHFKADVLQAVRRALGNRHYADGTIGFFHPGRFSFGQSVYLSRIYAALEAVDGVESAEVTLFERFWESANGELEKGVIAMGPWEIPRLDNDPNFQENGVLRLEAVGRH